MALTYRIGVDENGLGPRLGPLVVTAILARASEDGVRVLGKRLPKNLRASVDDSKRLMSHHDTTLGEAWARVLTTDAAQTPAELFEALSLEGMQRLQKPCPKHVVPQCWATEGEGFEADAKLIERVRRHRGLLEKRGVEIVAVKSSVICSERLSGAKKRGSNRFISDLHAMEELVLSLRKLAGTEVHAVCGKVGGMGEYGKFFGPLSNYLHAVVEEGKAKSTYRVPGVGEVSFVRDADESNPLVSLASLVGKYVRELFMRRIGRFYGVLPDDEKCPSGYHDPITSAFVERTALVRKRRKVPSDCFERAREELAVP